MPRLLTGTHRDTMCRKCCQCPGLDTPLLRCYPRLGNLLPTQSGETPQPAIIITAKSYPYLCLIKRYVSDKQSNVGIRIQAEGGHYSESESDYFVFDCSIAHPSATLQLESKDSDRESAVFLFPFIAHFDEDSAERATTSALINNS